MSAIDLQKYKIRTDLIVESIGTSNFSNIKKEEKKIDNIIISNITVLEDIKDIGKKKGNYITISFEDVTDTSNRKKLEDILTDELIKILDNLNISKDDSALVIGLGNYKSTPDSLGPKTLNDLVITRHLYLLGEVKIEEGYRNVSGFIPGVMGNTGIEAKDVILGLVKETKPKFVIVVDALASSSIDRVNKTIQMTDTGINPGSGVGNSRIEISQETVGVPVIAIGIPTVVDAVTIVSDTIKYLLKKFSFNKATINKPSHKLKPVTNINYLKENYQDLTEEDREKILGFLGNLSEEEVHQLIFEVLSPIGYNLMVTPKEVDFLIEKLAQVLSTCLNRCLHSKMNKRMDIA